MTNTEFREAFYRTPWRPMRIRLNDGRYYDISHPECVRVLSRSIAVFFPTDEELIYDGMKWLNLDAVVEVEEVELAERSGQR